MSQPSQRDELYKTLISPHFSEKASICADKAGQFVFRVRTGANKQEIKQAVEFLFKVKVKSVQVCRTKTKARRVGQIVGRSKSWKKAYVALQEGHDIDFTGVL